ncbi:hypothetical protein [Anaerosalibacter sp. Marseille-P3206]|uniref:hypothetical protein n=1 Tax=Anaerosalibacter sp. Marseille-P3206 TaxID=1871005 RepID=UPI000987B554|nr:hypothetical protein [Anaerosalibacter sp. Marseille-P3206]
MKKKDDDGVLRSHNNKWVLVITFWTFVMAVIFSIITENLMNNIDILAAFIILMFIIFVGIFFDIIGIAVTSAEERPFHAMAANKIGEAKYAVRLVRNAGQVSNFCNDVIGDISGIISGGAGTTIIYKLIERYDIKSGTILSIFVTALIASLTVGGKALGKEIAIKNSEQIIFHFAKVLNFLEEKFKITVLSDNKSNKKYN